MAITGDQFKQRFPLLLERLNHQEAENLLRALTQIEVSSGEELHHWESHADTLYLIWEGSLALAMMVGGKEIPLGSLRSGQLIGSVAIIEPGPSPTTATAAEPSTLLCLNHSGLKVLRTNQPRLAGNLLRGLSLDLAERLRVYEENMVERTRSSNDTEEFTRLCRPLMGIKSV